MNYSELKSSLREVLSTQATSNDYQETMEFIIQKCEDYGADWYVDEHDNLYVTKGIAKVYPCVVSHTDTVHDIYKGYKVYEVEGNYVAYDTGTMQQVGTGGDDKVGIWVCLEMLKAFDNIKLCFFAQEEIGCVGSSQADKDFFTDVGYAFECDRKGNADFVQNSSGVKMFGNKFKSAILPVLKSYNYTITDGGLTDVHEIAQDMGIACANMSCGYYKPHSNQEYVNISDAIHTCNLVKTLISSLGEVMYKHKAVNDWGYGSWYGGYTYTKPYKSYNSYPKVSAKKFSSCDMCGAISTDGCDFCTTEVTSITKEKEEVKACTCGGDLTKYNDYGGNYYHCRDCGFYEDDIA